MYTLYIHRLLLREPKTGLDIRRDFRRFRRDLLNRIPISQQGPGDTAGELRLFELILKHTEIISKQRTKVLSKESAHSFHLLGPEDFAGELRLFEIMLKHTET
jgi:hypothetical protein